MLAGLPYVVWPVGSLFILASRKKDDPFLHYHAWQGLLWGAAVGLLAIFAVIGLVVTFRIMPGSSTFVSGALGLGLLAGGGTATMLVFCTAIFLGWRATEGEMLRLPFMGDFAEEKMLDHTGMTRTEFNKMLEDSFIEPAAEPIPFPAVAEMPQLRGKAAEILAARGLEDATPASLKATELLAQRAAAQTRSLEPPAPAPASAPRPAAAAPRPAASGARPAAPAPRPAAAGTPPAPRPAAASAPPAPRPAAASAPPAPRPAAAAAQPSPRPAAQARPAAAPPANHPAGHGQNVKSYPLIREGGAPAANGVSPANVLQPSPPQRSAQPPQRAQSPAGWQGSPGQGHPPMPPAQGTPQVKEVDLVRHYKERRTPSAPQQSDALREWLSSVDDG